MTFMNTNKIYSNTIQEHLTIEIDKLLESLITAEEGISNLPTDNLDSMQHSLQVRKMMMKKYW